MTVLFSKPSTFSGRKKITAKLENVYTGVDFTPELFIRQIFKGSGESNNSYLIENIYTVENKVFYKTLFTGLKLKDAKIKTKELLENLSDVTEGGELFF